jgi:hypothetical protein
MRQKSNRKSESTCRTAIDFLLNECLTIMVSRPESSPKTLLNIRNPQKGLNETENTSDGDARLKTPSQLNNIKNYGEVSFTHNITPQTTICPSSNVVVIDRIDYSIGHILKTNNAVNQRRRHFYSLLLLVEAKFDRNVNHALAQLIVYQASLCQSRLQ